jgi:hypothetical protein
VLLHLIKINSPAVNKISADQAALFYSQPATVWSSGAAVQMRQRIRGSSEPTRAGMVGEGMVLLALELAAPVTPTTIEIIVEISFEDHQTSRKNIHIKLPCPSMPTKESCQ